MFARRLSVFFVAVAAVTAVVALPTAYGDGGLTISFEGQFPLANQNGWNNTDVTLTWLCDDGVSSWTVTQTLTSEGDNQHATGTCTDGEGDSVSDTRFFISIDKTPPELFCIPDDGPGLNVAPKHVPSVPSRSFYNISTIDAWSLSGPICLYDSASSFAAGPFEASAQVIKVTSAPGVTPGVLPGPGGPGAGQQIPPDTSVYLLINGNAILTDTDGAGNTTTVVCPFVP